MAVRTDANPGTGLQIPLVSGAAAGAWEVPPSLRPRAGGGVRLSLVALSVGGLGVLALTSGFGYSRFIASRANTSSRPVTTVVGSGSIAATVSANGTVASPTQSRLAFKIGGPLKELLVSVGQHVVVGQPLARIDDADLRAAMQQAQGNLSSAQARLDQVRLGTRPEDLAATQAQLDAARAKLVEANTAVQGPELAAAESQLETARIRLRQLVDGGRPEDITATQAQLDAANARLQALLTPRREDVAAAEAALDAANQRYQALMRPRTEDVTAAQSAVDSAKLRLLQLQNPRPEDVRNAEAALAGAKAKLQAVQTPRPEDVAQAQAAVEQQRALLANMVNQPLAAKPEDIANAQRQVQLAQVALDKANADAADPSKAGLGGFSLSAQSASAAVQQAQLNLEVAQNTLHKVQTVGPTDDELRAQQQGLQQAQAFLEKVRTPSATDVQAAKAAVDQAQAALDKVKNPTYYDLATAQEAVKQAQAVLDKLKNPSAADVAGAQQAIVAAQTTLDKLKNPSSADVQTAQQAVIAAQTTLDKLRTPLDPDVQAAQQAVAQAQATVDRLRTAADFGVQQAQASSRQAQAMLDLKRNGPMVQDIAIAAAAVEQAQAQVAQATTNLESATMVAPFSGTVGATVANPGEMLPPAAPVLTLIDTDDIRIDVAVDETDIAKVQPRQEVVLTFDGLPGRSVPGWVEVIGPSATVQQGVVSYTVQVRVDPAQAAGVRPGMTATANIVVARKESAILVPNRALRTLGDSAAVEIVEPDGTTKLRAVQTGLANDEVTEITGGVVPGEHIVLPRTGLDTSMPPQGTFAGVSGGTASGSAASGGSAGSATGGGAAAITGAGAAGTGPGGLGPQRSQR